LTKMQVFLFLFSTHQGQQFNNLRENLIIIFCFSIYFVPFSLLTFSLFLFLLFSSLIISCVTCVILFFCVFFCCSLDEIDWGVLIWRGCCVFLFCFKFAWRTSISLRWCVLRVSSRREFRWSSDNQSIPINFSCVSVAFFGQGVNIKREYE